MTIPSAKHSSKHDRVATNAAAQQSQHHTSRPYEKSREEKSGYGYGHEEEHRFAPTFGMEG